MTNVTTKMQELLSRLPRTDTPEFRSRHVKEYGKRESILAITPANILLALNRAREAHELAVSYRDFKVGASVVALAMGTRPRFEIMTGVNVKPDEESSMNVHAEQVALQKAKDRSYNRISVITTVGETQNDQQSGHTMHTLHPCGLCRGVLGESSLIDPDSTLIVSALPTLKTMELYNLSQLKQYHEDPASIELQLIELPDMELLRPFNFQDGASLLLEDTPESIAEERIWNSTVGSFSLQWRQDHLETEE